jgi:Rhs element Vgr protein
MEELLIPNKAKNDVASYNILINGNDTDPSYKLMSLSILKEVNRIPLVRIVFSDGDAAKRSFEISNKNDFVPGNKIQINLGRDSKNKQAFKGIIIRHAVKIKANGHTQFMVECMDECVRLTVGRHSRYFEAIKDSQVFDELAGMHSLKMDSEDTKLNHKHLVQHHISDWDFMLLRAEANGMLVIVNDGEIKIARPAIKSTEALQVNYGSSILEFESEIDARNQFKRVYATSWDYGNQQLFEAETSSVPFTEHGNISGDDIAKAVSPEKFELHHSGHKLEQELQDWTDGVLIRSRLSKIRGRVRCIGFGDIKPGDTLKISGISDRFNGKAYVTAVRQEIGNGNWETQIQFGLDPVRYALQHHDMEDLPSAGLIGAIRGLQVGVVVKLEGDPDGQDRIQVKIPVIDNNAQGIWTRLASLDAGDSRGACFRPEKGDEVIVGFINEDPRDAVILGMVHSSRHPAPIPARDANDEKGFTTRSKMHISFNDKTKTVKIDTPAGNSITLDENGKSIEIVDQNQNKIKMEPSGLSLESPKNIDIKAGAVLTLAGGTSLSVGAPSLSVKADADVSISGATTKVSAQGPTEIKGLPVKIN